jgi:glycosyltransferase involved in cell wall biosynthesis
MRIAVLTEIINRKSGARAPLEVAKALRQEGNDVTVFARPQDYEKEAENELKKFGVNIKIIKTNKLYTPFILYNRLNNQFDILSYHAKLPFLIGAKLSGLPIVRTYHGSQLNPISDKVFPKKPNWVIKFLDTLANFYILLNEFLLLHTSDKVLAISKYTKLEVKKYFGLNVNYIYYGASLEKNYYAKKKTNNKKITVLSVSRIIPYKGFHHIINIFNNLQNRHSNINLVIVGSSPDINYVKYLKEIAGKNVKILISISDEDLKKEYKNADIYTSYDRYMFFGLPLLEAAAYHLPVVAINKCAAPELVKHKKSGFLAKDAEEFEKYLEKLINDPKLRKRMGKTAFEISKRFSWDTFGKKYNLWFKETLKKSKQ